VKWWKQNGILDPGGIRRRMGVGASMKPEGLKTQTGRIKTKKEKTQKKWETEDTFTD